MSPLLRFTGLNIFRTNSGECLLFSTNHYKVGLSRTICSTTDLLENATRNVCTRGATPALSISDPAFWSQSLKNMFTISTGVNSSIIEYFTIQFAVLRPVERSSASPFGWPQQNVPARRPFPMLGPEHAGLNIYGAMFSNQVNYGMSIALRAEKNRTRSPPLFPPLSSASKKS